MRLKPQCGKCGTPHWPFVACEQADAVNAREEANAAAAAKAHLRKTVPVVNQFAGNHFAGFKQSDGRIMQHAPRVHMRTDGALKGRVKDSMGVWRLPPPDPPEAA